MSSGAQCIFRISPSLQVSRPFSPSTTWSGALTDVTEDLLRPPVASLAIGSKKADRIVSDSSGAAGP